MKGLRYMTAHVGQDGVIQNVEEQIEPAHSIDELTAQAARYLYIEQPALDLAFGVNGDLSIPVVSQRSPHDAMSVKGVVACDALHSPVILVLYHIGMIFTGFKTPAGVLTGAITAKTDSKTNLFLSGEQADYELDFAIVRSSKTPRFAISKVCYDLKLRSEYLQIVP